MHDGHVFFYEIDPRLDCEGLTTWVTRLSLMGIPVRFDGSRAYFRRRAHSVTAASAAHACLAELV